MERCEECGGVLTLIGGYDYYCPKCVVIDGKKGGEIVALMLGGIPPKEEEKVIRVKKRGDCPCYCKSYTESGAWIGVCGVRAAACVGAKNEWCPLNIYKQICVEREEKAMPEPKTIEVQIFVRHRDEHGNVTGKGFNQVLAFDAENGLRFARERFAQEVLPTTSNVGPKFTPRLSPKLVRQYVYDWLVGMVMEKMGRADE